MLAQQNRGGGGSKPILEINLRHPLVAAIGKPGNADAADLSLLLLEQAQILDGELPEDPAGFAGRINRLVLRALDLTLRLVMPALVAGIHVLSGVPDQRRGWPGQARP